LIENRIKVWRAADLHDAEMLKGVYVRHSYPWHAHEEVSLGLVVGGAVRLRTRSSEGIAKAGVLVLVNAEELHQGVAAAPEGWQCRTMHIHPDVIRSTAAEMKLFGSAPSVRFPSPTIDDANLVADLLELHRRTENGGSALDQQSRIVALAAQLLMRHADTRFVPPSGTQEPRAVRIAREYLDQNLSGKVTLDMLAGVTGITPFRLLRAFQQAVGITPHSYHVHVRIRAAHAMTRSGTPLADVAFATGFSDQAHLTRVFKDIMGATPGQHRMAARGKQ
jgi:AraC-like DNA-binding protein